MSLCSDSCESGEGRAVEISAVEKITSPQQLYQLTCQLDENLDEEGADLDSTQRLVSQAKALIGEIIVEGCSHPLHGAFTRLVTGTITLKHLWECALSWPVGDFFRVEIKPV